MKSILLPLSALVAAAAAKTAVMLPFYQYPSINSDGSLGTAWQSLLTAADANPSLTFYIIINPDSGPTARPNSGAYNDQIYGFNSDWVTALDKLNARKNVKTIGYVSTAWCQLSSSRPLSAIQADIENWSHWSAATNATGWGSPSSGSTWNVKIDGIFYDETATEETTATGAQLSCYKTLKSYTDSTFKAAGHSSAATIVFNPGAKPSGTMETGLFSMADAVVTAETCYTDVVYEEAECGTAGQAIGWTPFTASLMRSTPTTFLPNNQSLWSKSSVLVHGFNTVSGSSKPADTTTLADAIKSVVEQGVHSVYFTTKGWNSFSDPPADLTTVVADIAKVA